MSSPREFSHTEPRQRTVRSRRGTRNGPSSSLSPSTTRNPLNHRSRNPRGGSTVAKTTQIRNPRISSDSDGSDGTDDYWMYKDEDYSSDDLTLPTPKNSRWLREFFEWFDSLSDKEINDPTVRMHCPVCKDGPGATTWFNGFQTVLTHAENVRSKRMRLHRRFAVLLDGKMRRRYSGPRKAEEKVVEWKGVGEEVVDRLIVWPPAVVVQNTRSHRDESGKWVGVRKTELLGCFKHQEIRNVKNAYGRAGHCGVSLLIFDSSAAGYLEAESLHRQLAGQGRGKHEWETRRRHTQPSLERLLYGYLATEGDMELFNRHSRGQQKHKYEMESYKVMVVNSLKKIKDNDDDRLNMIVQKLHLREIEIKTIRQKAVEKIEESINEIDYLDKYYVETIKQLSDDLEKAKMEREEIQKSFAMLPNCRHASPSVA